MSSTSSRGQTLLLFSLTMLLLTLMVLVTLGIGSRVKDRMEAQIAADAAAYSEAVMVARTFNAVAIVNRAEIATMVSMAGVQSLISWSGQQRTAASAMKSALLQAAASCPAAAATIALIIADLNASTANVAAQWDAADAAAGMQAKALQGMAGGLGDEGQTLFEVELKRKLLNNQWLAERVAKAANPDFEARAAGDKKNLEEVGGNEDVNDPNPTHGCWVEPCPSGAVDNPNQHGHPMVFATMGTRGWSFTTSGNVTGLGGSLSRPGVAISISGGGGGGGFGGGAGASGGIDGRHRSQQHEFASGVEAWGENDDGNVTVTVTVPGCAGASFSSPVGAAWVRSTDQQDTGGRQDQHHYPTGPDDPGPAGREEKHSMGPCGRCPGIWPSFLDFNEDEVANAQNDYGQPKLLSVIERDYATVPSDPWNLHFKFRLGNSGTPSDFNNAAKTGRYLSDPILRRQVVVSSAIAYYHRPGPQGWREPPNFLNPFWRATLAPPDSVNRPNNSDLGESLSSAGYGGLGQIFNRLRNQGFKGFQ